MTVSEEQISILYEDADTLVIDKPEGFLSEHSENVPSVVALLAHRAPGGVLSPITRLDREVSGVMLLAKNKKSAAFYTAELADRERFRKEYLAVVTGRLDEKEGVLKDLLFKDSSKNKSYVVTRMRRGVKEASLAYRVLDEREANGIIVSLVHIHLHTGRTHQIRVQFSSRRHPIVGDRKYGGGTDCPMGLLSYRLSLTLTNGKKATFMSERAELFPFSLSLKEKML